MEQTPLPPACHQLANVHELPSVDLTKSVKSMILAPRSLRRFNAVMSKLNRPMLFLYGISCAAEFTLLVVPVSTGVWLAVAKVACQLPLLLQGIASLRVDIVKCLLSTYEFWFLSVTNVLNCAMFVLYFGDARAMVVLVFFLGSQLNICVDANLQIDQLLGASLIAILHLVCLLVTVAFQLTPGTKAVILVEYNGHTMSNCDVILSTASIMAIYMVRTVYRKYSHAKTKTERSTTIRCVTYRCRVKFQVQQQTLVVPIAPHSGSFDADIRVASVLMVRQQLRFVTRELDFNESDVVDLRVVNFFGGPGATSATPWKTRALYGLGICSLVFNLVPIVWKKFPFQSDISFAVYCCALPCTTCFFAAFVASFNRQLLSELVYSFDFCFLSAQFSVIHLCICELFFWDARCFNVLYIWLSIHWVLTLDALTPASRARLGLQIRFVIPVIVFITAGICRVSLDLVVFRTSRPTDDRVLWAVRLLDHTIEFRIVPFILNRTWTVLLWCFRILWKLWTSDENGRILIQGSVEFVVNRAALRGQSRRVGRFSRASLPNVLAHWAKTRVSPDDLVPRSASNSGGIS